MLSIIRPPPDELVPIVVRPLRGLPSLLDVVRSGAISASGKEFSDLVETWLTTRVQLYDQVRRYLEKLFQNSQPWYWLLFGWSGKPVKESDFLRSVVVYGKGKFGTVSVGCLAPLDSRLPFMGSGKNTCKNFPFRIEGTDETFQMPVYVANKIVMDVHSHSKGMDPFVIDEDGTSVWSAAENPLREFISGRMLNYIVKAGKSPHLPLLYETYETEMDGRPASGVVMELAHMDFNTFFEKVFVNIRDATVRRNVLEVTVIQILQALTTAQIYFDFRHNDLHIRNIMVTFVENTTYCYSISGRTYAVPNYGLCWRLIDFGYSSSDVLFGETDILDAYEDSKTLGFTRSIVVKYAPELDRFHFPAELNDVVRLVTSMILSFGEEFKPAEKEFLIGILETMNGFGVDTYHTFARGQTRRLDKRERLRLVSSQLLLIPLFTHVAARYQVHSTRECEEVYEMNGPLFEPNQQLTGIEEMYFYVNDRGRVVRKP